MKHNIYILIILIIGQLFLIPQEITAQTNVSQDTLVLDQGQEEIWQKKISSDIIQQYKDKPEYKYDLAPVESLSLWQRIKLWLANKFLKLISQMKGLWWATYLIVGLVLLLFLSRLAHSTVSNIFRPQKQVIPINFSQKLDPTQKNWQELIPQAASRGEYRLAIRYYFLFTLKTLHNKGIICWRDQKTNKEYLNEINDIHLQTNFNQLTGLYEAIWYGDFPIGADDYQIIANDFLTLHHQLSATNKNQRTS